MGRDQTTDFTMGLVGRGGVIGRREHGWFIDMADGVGVAVSAPWRIVAHGRIALARDDDGQLFGLAARSTQRRRRASSWAAGRSWR